MCVCDITFKCICILIFVTKIQFTTYLFHFLACLACPIVNKTFVDGSWKAYTNVLLHNSCSIDVNKMKDLCQLSGLNTANKVGEKTFLNRKSLFSHFNVLNKT